MCNESAYLFFSLQTDGDGDDGGEHVKVAKKKKKRKRKSSSNDDSDEEAERRRRRRSKKKRADRRDHEGDREDGEISDEDECSDEMPTEREKPRSRNAAVTDDKWKKNATIEIMDSSESTNESEQSFSNGIMQGTQLVAFDDQIRADFIAHTFHDIIPPPPSCRKPEYNSILFP